MNNSSDIDPIPNSCVELHPHRLQNLTPSPRDPTIDPCGTRLDKVDPFLLADHKNGNDGDVVIDVMAGNNDGNKYDGRKKEKVVEVEEEEEKKMCRVCHMGAECLGQYGDFIELGCNCRSDLGTATATALSSGLLPKETDGSIIRAEGRITCS